MDSTSTVVATQALNKVLPTTSEPQWYFAFIVLALLAWLLGAKWLELKRKRGLPGETGAFQAIRVPRPETPPPAASGVPPIIPGPISCADHTRRLDAMDDAFVNVYRTMEDRLRDTERTLQESIRKQFSDFRQEQDRRDQGMRTEVSTQLAASEKRMSEALDRMVASIGSMFRQAEDGIRIPSQIPRP